MQINGTIKQWLESFGKPVADTAFPPRDGKGKPNKITAPFIVFLDNAKIDGSDDCNLFTLHDLTIEYYTNTSNTDVCTWSKKMNKYGHVAIATGAGDTNKFISYDMNWGGKELRMVEHDYDYFLGVLRPIDRTNIDGAKLYRVKKAVNVRKGPGTNFDRMKYDEFTAYQQEQVLANGGKAADNDFPKGMLIESYETKGSWHKISKTEEKWVHKNYLQEL